MSTKYERDEDRRVRMLREDQERWVMLLEGLLLEAEDRAIDRGDWGLIDCQDDKGGFYQSQTCASVINNIRERHMAKRKGKP